MIRPRYIGGIFALCLAVVLVTMGWLTATIRHLEVAETQARRDAALEESVRLALWRMDSTLSPLIARESARPYFTYSSFYPAERALTRMFHEIEYGDVLIPSPLLTEASPYVRLHFQIGADDVISSPQMPEGALRSLAESRYVSVERLGQVKEQLAALSQFARRVELAARLPLEHPPAADLVTLAPQQTGDQQQAELPQSQQQMVRNTLEVQARNRAVQQSTENIVEMPAVGSDVAEGVLRPIWVHEQLLLARRVIINDREYVQGCWLDWPAIQAWLTDEIADLFPGARLEPLPNPESAPGERVLAALPIRLVPGLPALGPGDARSPLSLSLWIAWLCVSLAAAAVVVLLVGTVSLSERRGAFVSAVTHELRTPLTTFRLYTEMLNAGMVLEEDKRRSYLSTLQSEAVRLTHLVDNVLAYARLERGRAARQLESVLLSELSGHVTPRLADHAQQAGLHLVVEPGPPPTGTRRVRADRSAVEQILFNLVDNACKYARGSTPGTIHLSILATDDGGVLRVRDHGPGIAPGDFRRLFHPFHKSARDAANSAPGIGLGLALSRRLARAMGGELVCVAAEGQGACFEVRLRSE